MRAVFCRVIAVLGVYASFVMAGWVSAAPLTITSNPYDWKMSTIRGDGGYEIDWRGPDWTGFVSASGLPDISTYTVTPATNAPAWILNPANDLGVTALAAYGGNNTNTGVQFFRTTFNYFDISSAIIDAVVDNNVQIFINRHEVARTTRHIIDYWYSYPKLSINADGSVTSINMFEQTFAFGSWNQGLNEIVLVVRNANNESDVAGGLAFKMIVEGSSSAVPEPMSAVLLLAGGAILLGMRRNHCAT